MVMRMGRWSEERLGRVVHEVWRAMDGEHAVRSGEVGWCFELKGSRVGLDGSFKVTNGDI